MSDTKRSLFQAQLKGKPTKTKEISQGIYPASVLRTIKVHPLGLHGSSLAFILPIFHCSTMAAHTEEGN